MGNQPIKPPTWKKSEFYHKSNEVNTMEAIETNHNMSAQSFSLSRSLSDVCQALSKCLQYRWEMQCVPPILQSELHLKNDQNGLGHCYSPKCSVKPVSTKLVSDSSSPSSGYESNEGNLFVPEDQFIKRMGVAIAKLAHNNKFDSAKHAKRKKRRVIPRIYNLWWNPDSIFSTTQLILHHYHLLQLQY